MKSLKQAHFPLDSTIREFADRFDNTGHSLYVVGGAVRDWLLGIPNDDYDFTTDAKPEEVMAMFRKVIPTGIKHGTVTVLYKGARYEVTTFRIEDEYQDHRHPQSVRFVRNLEEDLKRRDFTINAIAADALTGQIIDRHNGIGDLGRKVIRAIGDPRQRFAEDALRILRACRFATKLDFEIDTATYEAMRELAPTLRHVSGERVRDELVKMLSCKHPLHGFELLHASGILQVLLPEVEAGDRVEQKGMHRYDVLTHGFYACQAAADLDAPLEVRIAALLHDIGKPSVRHEDENGDFTFYKHEFVSEKQAKDILDRLKFSNSERDRILNLIRNHMFHYTSDWSDGAVRRFIARVGEDALGNLFLLRLADQKAICGRCDFSTLQELQDRIERILKNRDALTVKDLAINGNDLLSLGIPADQRMGVILARLLEAVLDDPSQNTKEQLSIMAKHIARVISELQGNN
ncbi:MAG: CCA tRNA nucleotidyltransferase [Sphaerochaetaceae bacterium]|jgi:tRNA nucleotidyltransferase/poly(A) polymerase